WITVAFLVVRAAGAAYYFKNQSAAKTSTSGGQITSVSSVALGLGDVTATIRVNGTVSAQNFQALLAPRILGSRTGFNRGGDGGGAGGPGGGGDRGGGPGGGGPGGDFNLVLMELAKPGSRVKTGEIVAKFDP